MIKINEVEKSEIACLINILTNYPRVNNNYTQSALHASIALELFVSFNKLLFFGWGNKVKRNIKLKIHQACMLSLTITESMNNKSEPYEVYVFTKWQQAIDQQLKSNQHEHI